MSDQTEHDDPWPIEGSITPRSYGYSANLDAVSEYITESEHGDMLQRAVDRAAREHGEDVEVGVRFTADSTGLQCGDYELLGPVDGDTDE